MATHTATMVAQINSTTLMRAHVAFFETLMTNAGWVQTADTGQTAAAAFASGSGTNTVAGYQIWRMNDALQGTYPVYVKFEFGSGATSNCLSIWITVGTGSNGTGTITGILGARTQTYSVATSASTLTSYGSGTSSRVGAVHLYQSVTSNTTFMWNIERSKDATGANTSDGVILQMTNGVVAQTTHQYLAFTGSLRAAQTYASTIYNGTALGTNASGGNVGIYPIFPIGILGPVNPCLGLVMYYGPDIAALTSATMSVRGSNHVYLTLGTPYGWVVAVTGYTSSSYALLYE